MSHPTPTNSPASPASHSIVEDILAILTGTLFVSLGVTLFKQAGLFTGGTAGISFLIHYATGISFGIIFFTINLPFYWFSWKRFGWKFTIKTFISVALVAIFSDIHPHMLQLSNIAPLYSAFIGATLMGVGFVVLFRHQASLGGFNILALYLQERHGISAGKLQMVLDVIILIASLSIVASNIVLISILGALILNCAIMLNHRPGRYMAV
jgi:uncharacterized membrane-anchored protein YitT (DUF2179 family)